LLAQVLAFEQGPEGLARCRIFEQELQTVSRGLPATEQTELDSLRKLYPDVGVDCDDPLSQALEACGRAAKKAKDDALKARP
jgi:hypothetical protein